MVSPIFLIAASLGFAFLLPLFELIGRRVAAAIGMLLALATAAVGVGWLAELVGGAGSIVAETAGFLAPLSIRLEAGLLEAAAIVVVNLVVALTVGYHSFRAENPWSGRRLVLLFVLAVGANGLILTRDLFNAFVFMEIGAIAFYGILAAGSDRRRFEAGFKYMIAGGIASAFYLVGTIFLYRVSGTLSIDEIAGSALGNAGGVAGLLAFAFFAIAILIELKPAPANGWALDTYEAADAGTGGLLSAVSTTATALLLIKVLPLFAAGAPAVITAATVVGALSFIAASIMALSQQSARRMLGLSSVAQTGLAVFVAGLLSGAAGTPAPVLGSLGSEIAALFSAAGPAAIAVALLLNHALAKAALFWLVGIAGVRSARNPISLRNKPFFLILAGVAVFALIGLPPFPSFWAKWSLLTWFGTQGLPWPLVILLLGSLLEAAYLVRWFLALSRRPDDELATTAEDVPSDFAPSSTSVGVPVAVPEAAGVSSAVAAGVPVSSGTAAGGAVDPPAPVAVAPVAAVSATVAVGPAPVAAGPAAAAPARLVFPAVAVALLVATGAASALSHGLSLWTLLPIAVLFAFAFLDLLHVPQKLQVALGIGALAAAGVGLLPGLSLIKLIFVAIFLGGTALQLFAFFTRKGRGEGTIALIVAMAMSLAGVVIAETRLELFLSWELMTVTSFLLVQKGRRGAAGSLRYVLFSLLSAYLLVTALVLLPAAPAGGAVAATAGVGEVLGLSGAGAATAAAGPLSAALAGAGTLPIVLLVLAAVIKLGNLGFHIWLPSAYAEAPDDVSPLFSSVLSKAGVFLLLAMGGAAAVQLLPSLESTFLAGLGVNALIGWLGVATALGGALMAVFQEDIKYALAYSSMGQLGYVVLAISMMSHLGHVTGLYLTIVHTAVKAMIWLAILGVIQRTKTRLMYQMGGLIKRMPVSFIVVLFGIIVVSGVPPLAGFGGKWLIYTALIEQGWYLQAGLAFFAGAVTFLYLYRLIHSIFLGQPKDRFADLKEAPIVQLVPQLILLVGLMLISMFPQILIEPLQAAVEPLFASTVVWEESTVISSLGYWSGSAVMYVTMGVFGVPFVLLLILNGRKVKKAKQFNIVYAAERPYKPETTHYAFNFFGHYQKALGFLARPWAERGWTGFARLSRTIGDGLRRWNTGNAQTYGFQILLFVVVVIVALRGGF